MVSGSHTVDRLRCQAVKTACSVGIRDYHSIKTMTYTLGAVAEDVNNFALYFVYRLKTSHDKVHWDFFP